MENQATKIIKQLSARMHTREADMWNLYYESGLSYIDELKHRISHLRQFVAQFGALFSSGMLNISPEETFTRIQNSPEFWAWWATNLWGICATTKPKTKGLLYHNSTFSTEYIPVNILNKILNNDNHLRTKQTIDKQPKGITRRHEVAKAEMRTEA